MKFLRLFPGEKDFLPVPEKDWNAKLPLKDVGGWGHVLRLEADVRVFSPGGELVSARKWPSKSYIRNFARIMRMIFGETSIPLVDKDAVNQTTGLDTGTQNNTAFIPTLIQTPGAASNPEWSGAAMAIGDGVPNEDHTRNDLVSRVGGIYSARQNLRTTVQDTTTLTLEVTTGVTNGQSGSLNIQEIALFLNAIRSGDSLSDVGFQTLLAYDGIASTPVAAGGVIAPRYTLDFPV